MERKGGGRVDVVQKLFFSPTVLGPRVNNTLDKKFLFWTLKEAFWSIEKFCCIKFYRMCLFLKATHFIKLAGNGKL